MQLIISIISAVVATLALSVCLRLRKPIYAALTLLILPVVALIFVNPKFAVLGWHEFMHASIVFNILNGLTPPEDVLLAGYPLKYPWIHHYLVAELCRILHIAPSMGFAILNHLALIASTIVIYKIAQLLHPTKQTGIFAVFLSIFGTSFFFLPIMKIGEITLMDTRTLPLHKFASANSNSLGFCFFFVCLFFLIRLFIKQGKSYINGIVIALSITALAFLYPICWLAASATCIFVCFGQTIAHRGRNWQSVFIVLLALLFGSAIAVPYLHSITEGKAATAEASVGVFGRHLLKVSLPLLLVSGLPLFVLWMKRHHLKALLKERQTEALTLISGGVGLTLLLMFVKIPLNCEYKFIMLLMAVIGIFTAPLFSAFYQENVVFAKTVILLLFLPTTLMFTGMFGSIDFSDSVRTSGISVRHDDTRMDKLYSWIANKTPVNTVVVDSFLSVPVLSRRSLYVATDLRRQQVPSWTHRGLLDGWSLDANTLSTEVYGQNQAVVKRRLQNAIALLTPNPKNVVNAAAGRIQQDLGQRQAVVIVRDPATQAAFEGNPRFVKKFEQRSTWVYAIRKS